MDDLCKILDRVDVVVVRRRDEIDARLRVARQRDLLGDLARRQVASLARLRALADLDLEVVRRVREQRGHAEATGCDLLAAIARVPADEIGQLAALAVDAEEIEPRHGLGVRAVRGLALRSEGHRRDVEGRRVLTRTRVGGAVRVIEGTVEVDEVPQRDRMRGLELAQLLRVRGVRSLAVRDGKSGLPRTRPDPEGRLEPRVATLAEHRRAREALLGDPVPPEPHLVARTERLEP